MALLYPSVPYTYTTNSDATITITGYTGSGGGLTIPDTINGLPVTSIGDRAFQSCQSVTTVTLSDGITNVGRWAFWYCPSLTSVSLPNASSIGYHAFMNFTS